MNSATSNTDTLPVDEEPGLYTEWGTGDRFVSPAERIAVEAWAQAAYRRAAQAESTVRWAAFTSARAAPTEVTNRAMGRSGE
jgi:hypothetical protein